MSRLGTFLGKGARKTNSELQSVSEQLFKMEIENEKEKKVAENRSARRGPRNGARRIRCDSDDLEEIVSSQRPQEDPVEELARKLVEGLVRRLKEEMEE
jgi:hypothetical protein